MLGHMVRQSFIRGEAFVRRKIRGGARLTSKDRKMATKVTDPIYVLIVTFPKAGME